MPKTSLRTLSKIRQKDDFLWTVNRETQHWESNEFKVKRCLWGKHGSYLTFSFDWLIGLCICVRVAELEKKESPKMTWTDMAFWGITVLGWFLRGVISYCSLSDKAKFCFALMCSHWPITLCSHHKWLHLNFDSIGFAPRVLKEFYDFSSYV